MAMSKADRKKVDLSAAGLQFHGHADYLCGDGGDEYIGKAVDILPQNAAYLSWRPTRK